MVNTVMVLEDIKGIKYDAILFGGLKKREKKLTPCCVIYRRMTLRWTLVFCCLLFVIYI